MQDTKSPAGWKRNAGFFIAGQFFSMFGSMLVQYAVTWNITLEQKSGVLMALFTAAAMLPMVFISPFAGVWADRYNRKYLINIADASIALVTLIVAIIFSFGHRDVWILLIAVMIRSVGQGVQQPAVNAIIPQIVPEEHLTRFNGIQSTLQSLIMFAAPMAALALLTVMPIERIFYIDVVTAAFGISTVFFCVKVSKIESDKERGKGVKAYFSEMAEGWSYIKSQPWLKILLVATFVFLVLAAPSAMLTPLQVARTFGDDYWRLTAVEIAFSSGMMLGGIIISVWGGFKNKVHSMVLAWLFFGVSSVLFGLMTNFWIYLGVMAFCGCTMPLYNTPSMTLLQTKIPPQLMGRVFSLLMIINGIGMPLGMVLFGPLGDVYPIEILLVTTGVLLLIGGLVMFGQKILIQAGEPAGAEKGE